MSERTKSVSKTVSTGKKISRSLVKYHLHNNGTSNDGRKTFTLTEIRDREIERLKNKLR